MGITDVIVKVNPDLTGLADPWRLSTLRSIVERLKVEGLNVVGLEGDPFDMTPIKEYGSRKGREEQGGAPSRCAMANGGAGSSTSLGLNREERKYNFETSAALRLCVKNKFDISREEALSHYRELLESMGRLGIKLLCYNFMVGKGWSRTGVREGRGGAKATYFKVEGEKLKVESSSLRLSHEQVWANYEYFIKAVMPTAEKCGVRMALHPDDPCLDSLGGYARIFGSIEAYDRAYAIYPSPSNAVTFCQANFKLMDGNNINNIKNNISFELGATAPGNERPESARGCEPSFRKLSSSCLSCFLIDAARHFGKRIAFIHVRDVEGTKEDFTELFHDQGDTDQFALMRTYRELGLDVPVRGDHVPEMAYDRVLTPEGTPGYFTLGRLFANGYLKALLKSIA
jgi:mannonate dehydratase